MSDDFHKTAVQKKKKKNCKLKLHSKGLTNNWGVPVLKFLRRLALDFPYIYLSAIFPGTFLQINV